MRVVLFTGKGGVGKTTAAAATAAYAARRGVKTLVISADAAHSLADVLQSPPSAEPAEVAPSLYVAQPDPRRLLMASWESVQEYLTALLRGAGVDPLTAHEVTVLPGVEEILTISAVSEQIASGRFDLVVVDCAPTAETLRLLALPEAVEHYLSRLFPMDATLARLLGPRLRRSGGVGLPEARVVEGVARLRAELAGVRAVLTAPETSVRLVLTPDRVVLAESRRTLTMLGLYGYRVDALLANRIFPDDRSGAWHSHWAQEQRRAVAELELSVAPMPVLRADFCAIEPLGPEILADLGETIYGAADPLTPPAVQQPVQVSSTGTGFSLEVTLPFAARGEVTVSRRADDLIIEVGSRARVLALPGVLRRCLVSGARLDDGVLSVGFEPDPSLWLTP